MNCLIGYSGFVGSNLMQRNYSKVFNSKNIHQIEGMKFDEITCAGVYAEKWKANLDEQKDWKQISELAKILKNVKAKKFTLISTVDVYNEKSCVDEDSKIYPNLSDPYGRNRYKFENLINDLFSDTTIVRLPGLFGPGLKKNIIFDMANKRLLDQIQQESIFQWYDITRLPTDIDTIHRNNIRLINLVTEPIKTKELIKNCFSEIKLLPGNKQTVSYDIRTKYASIFNSDKNYIESSSTVFQKISKWKREL